MEDFRETQLFEGINMKLKLLMKSSLLLVVGVFISSDSLADDRCGNTPQFLAEQRARAGGQAAPAGRALLSAPRAGQSAENGPKLAAPYRGSNSLGEPLMSALNTGWVFERTTVIDENTTRIAEEYIFTGRTDPDDPEADQDGWVVDQQGWFEFEFHVFKASLVDEVETWDDIEFLVNTDFTKAEALPLVERTVSFLSNMPFSPVLGIDRIVIHKAKNGRATGGPSDNVMTIYTNTIESADRSFLNTLYHEMAHISVEEYFYSGELGDGWDSAVEADGGFLTEYGENNPETEDFAETWVPWVRLKYFSDYATAAQAAVITKQVSNRLTFLDSVSWADSEEDYFWPISTRNYLQGEKSSQASLEEPVNGGIHSGISNIRGWAVSKRGVGRVAVYVDGAYAFEAPLGGARTDVGGVFPDSKDSVYSGFGLTYNYGALSPGEHTMTIRAYGLDGSVTESSSTFTVASFHSEFFPADRPVDLGAAMLNASGDELTVQGAKIDGVDYDLVLKWQVPSQSFQVISAD